MNNIFLETSVLLALTVSIAFLVRSIKQPLVIAYLVAGIIAGPLFLNLVSGDKELFHAFAEFGVVLLLFVIGLSLNFNAIKKVGKIAFLAGTAQALITVPVALALLMGFGFKFFPALYVAVAITFSSTIIIVKLLADKRDLESMYGRYTVGLLLVQDLIAIVIMLFLTTVKTDASIFESFMQLTAKGILLAMVVYALSRFGLPLFLKRVASSGEFLFIFTIAWCFGVASLVYWVGFPVEIGAVVAGLSLGSSHYQLEIASKIKPLRDFFIMLFFIILGSELGFAEFKTAFLPGLALAVFILVAKPVILYGIFRVARFTRRNSVFIGLTAAQVSEFGFIILFTGANVGLVGDNEVAVLTIAALVTYVVSSYLITYNSRIFVFLRPFFGLFEPDAHLQPEEKPQAYDVWVVGYHRLGWKICEALKEKNVSFGVIDFNPRAIEKLKHRGIPAFFGDISDVEFLEVLPLEKAKMIVVTVPDHEDQLTLIEHVRHRSKKPLIVCSLQHSDALPALYAAGADYVMLPHLAMGALIAEVLKNNQWSRKLFSELADDQKKELQLRFTAGAHDTFYSTTT